MSQNLANRVKELIESNLYVTIATCNESKQPWNTPVYAIHDKELNFFWRSWKKSEHSKNIEKNPNVFMVIYDTTRQLGQNHQRCVYIQAKAYEINNPKEAEFVASLFPKERQEPPGNFLGDKVKRLYKAVPEKIWLNDISEREVTKETIKMRVPVPLEKLIN